MFKFCDDKHLPLLDLKDFKKVLEENPTVRWTLGFIHKPLWTAPDLDKNGWGAMEKLLAGRKYTSSAVMFTVTKSSSATA